MDNRTSFCSCLAPVLQRKHLRPAIALLMLLLVGCGQTIPRGNIQTAVLREMTPYPGKTTTARQTINPTTQFRLAETRRIVLSGPWISRLKGGPEVIEDPNRIAAIVAGLDQSVPLGQEEAVTWSGGDFSAQFERADGTIVLYEYFGSSSIFFRNRFSDEHSSVPLMGVAAVLDIFGVFGGPRVR